MDHNEITNIDELLNSYIDGELDARHQTEVQRLIKHDKKIAERLQSLKKCRRLVSSLPYAEAPEGMLEGIKASLEEKKLIEQPTIRSRQGEGARHLLVRRFVAAAAMIALVAVLGVVVYTIVAPEPVTTDRPVAVAPEVLKPEPVAIVATAEEPVEMEFTGRLELKTSSPSEITAFINKAIELNIPSDQRSAAMPAESGESHILTCSRQNLRALMDELGTIWDKINSATLVVNTDGAGQILVDAVTPSQVIEIAKQDDFQTQIKTARFFAAMNNMAERTPGKEVLAAVDKSSPSLITIPKPVLTSSEKPAVKPSAQAEGGRMVRLTITVVEH